MAQQNRTILKNYFQTGDKPSQAQYADLIDSKVNLSESNTGDIELRGNINILTGNLTASGNISASGILTGEGLVISDDASITDTLTVGTIANVNTTHITASGNISASGNILADSGSFNYIESINKIRHTNDINTEVSFASDTVVIKANNRETFRGGSNFTRVGNDDTPTRISGSSVIFNSPINTTSNIATSLNITATGTITSTGNITSNSGTGSFAGGVVLTAPNGNQFRFTINNSGHLSLTGSAV